MKNLTVIIDRIEDTNIAEAKAAIEELLAALQPYRDRGLRVRVGRSPLTLKEDKAWK